VKRAWLITWEWIGDHAKKENKIVSILNYRVSPRNVRDYVERLYVDSEYSFTERVEYAKSRKNNPYPAEFDRINGVPWEGRIHCGHNPFLFARFVTNLRVELNADQREHLRWEEIPRPKLPKL
jgi:hypothetical protein